MSDISGLFDALVAPLSAGNQYIRKVSLLVYGSPSNPGGTGLAVPSSPSLPAPPAGTSSSSASSSPTTITVNPLPGSPGLDLSNNRIQFRVNAMDLDTPPTATIRVINLAQTTAEQIKQEFQNVVLQAGYVSGNYGVIFKGTIIRLRKGRLDNLDSFVDIMASNFDILYNFAFANTTVKNAKAQDQINALQKSVNSTPVAQGTAGALSNQLKVNFQIPGAGGVLPRGKVMFGLARKYLKQIADTNGGVWSVQPDGTVVIKPMTGHLPNPAVEINAQTGLIGVPQATTQGIEVDCLLNPNIVPGTRIRLTNKELVQTQNNQGIVGFPAYGNYQFFPSINNDGYYTAIVVEHEGDTRGEGANWLTHIVALDVDQSTSGGVGAYP